MPPPNLLAISDLHVANPANRAVVEGMRPVTPDDWLLVVGDVAELTTDVGWALRTLRDRFGTVVWAPGNHELWTMKRDPVQLRGEARYLHLVELCRSIGVVTPEDPYLVWEGPPHPAVIAPLHLLYDHTFRPWWTADAEAARAAAYAAGVVCADDVLLHSEPYPSTSAWCRALVARAEARLDAIDPALPTVLVNHFPLVREPTDALHHPELAQWCGTTATADWHRRYRAAAVVYGHLHIPARTELDGVPFHEVSLGLPQEWRRRGSTPGLRCVLPDAGERPLAARC